MDCKRSENNCKVKEEISTSLCKVHFRDKGIIRTRTNLINWCETKKTDTSELDLLEHPIPPKNRDIFGFKQI